MLPAGHAASGPEPMDDHSTICDSTGRADAALSGEAVCEGRASASQPSQSWRGAEGGTSDNPKTMVYFRSGNSGELTGWNQKLTCRTNIQTLWQEKDPSGALGAPK